MVETKSELSSFWFEVTKQVKKRFWISTLLLAEKRDQLTKSPDKKKKLIQDFPDDVHLHLFVQSFVKTHENDEKSTYK